MVHHGQAYSLGFMGQYDTAAIITLTIFNNNTRDN